MPANAFFRGGANSVQAAVPLGTGAVSTQTRLVGVVPMNMRVTGIRFVGTAAPTATTLTADVVNVDDESLLDAAADIDFADAAAALAGVDAVLDNALTKLAAGDVLRVVVTADTCSAGPGDLGVVVEYEPTVK